MSTANTSLKITELDFLEIRNNLKEFLQNQSEFQDYNFEGSGLGILLDILAYNTHYNAFYLNMVANEMFLDTAQLRNSILSHAKLTNYVPESAHGALAKVNITVTPSINENQVVTTTTLDKYTRVLGADKDGVNYPFVTIYANNAIKVDGSFSFANVWIKQGQVVTQQYTMETTNTKRRFKIPSSNVDIDSLVVTVQASASNSYTESYQVVDDLTLIDANTNAYFVEEDTDSKYTIYFGDGVIGKRPATGSIVIATYLDTVGSAASDIQRFSIVEDVGGLFSDNVRVASITSSTSGTDKEPLESIRFRAPYHYTTQNRAITKLDYETLITEDYPIVESVSVWGGEENDPPVYGKVYLSLKTFENYELTNLEKENIKNELIRSRNVLTVIPEIVDPDYEYILVRGSVTYNPSLTSLDANEILNLVRESIFEYNNVELNKFSSTFRKSKLQTYVEQAEKSITGSDISILLQKRVLITADSSTRNYSIPYNTKLRKGDFINKLYSYPPLEVSDLEGVTRQVYFEEIPNSFTGVDSIAISNPGLNYTSAPTITITGDGLGATAVPVIVNGKIDKINVTNKGSNYTRATVSITGGGGSEATAYAVLEAKLGELRTYYYKTNGEKVVVDPAAGTINYDTGVVALTELTTSQVVDNDFYDTDILTLNAPSDKEIIIPMRNRILTIDENDASSIQIDMVPE
jgi:hypothetical protein